MFVIGSKIIEEKKKLKSYLKSVANSIIIFVNTSLQFLIFMRYFDKLLYLSFFIFMVGIVMRTLIILSSLFLFSCATQYTSREFDRVWEATQRVLKKII